GMGGADGRRYLAKKVVVACHGAGAEIECLATLDKNLRTATVGAEPVIQSEPQRVDGEIGSETLRTSGKVHAFSAVIGKEIFGARRPTRCQRNFYAGARSTAEARHHEMIFDRPGGGRAADRCA